MGKLRHESLPCPARGLELVVYPEAAVVRPTAEPAFELELNSGSNMPELVAFDSAERPASLGTHWYVIDRAIVSERGIPLAGPPAPEVFAPVPRELVLPTLAESLRWHALDGGSGSRPDDAVLNACRALRYAAGAGWASKPEAGRWALRRFGPDELISRALHERQRGEAARR